MAVRRKLAILVHLDAPVLPGVDDAAGSSRSSASARAGRQANCRQNEVRVGAAHLVHDRAAGACDS